MQPIKKMVFFIVFSPLLFFIALWWLLNQYRQKYCRRHLFTHLNLEIIDGLSLQEFTNIFKIMLKARHYKVYEHVCQTHNKHTLVAVKKHTRILIHIVPKNQLTSSDVVSVTIRDKICYACDHAVMVTNLIFPKQLLEEAKQKNIQVITRQDLQNFLTQYQKPKEKRQMANDQ